MKDEPKYYGVWFEPVGHIGSSNWLSGSDEIPIITSQADAIQRASEMNQGNKAFRYAAKPIDFLPAIKETGSASVFAITCSAFGNPLRDKLYASQDKAQAALKEIVKDRSGKLVGVQVIENEPNRFSLGWEECKISFAIVELSVE
jgi:hypothetical protein